MKTFYSGNRHQLVILFRKETTMLWKYWLIVIKTKFLHQSIFLVKDKYLAEDIFQDVFIKIIDTLRKQVTMKKVKFLPWALRIAHNLCVDHFRKVKRTPTITTGDDQDIFEVINVHEDGADKAMMTGQSHDRIRRLVDMLPDEQREVIVLRHYADLSFKEIAEMNKLQHQYSFRSYALWSNEHA